MAHFTQLGLSGKPEDKSQGLRGTNPRPASSGKKFSGKQKIAAVAASLIASSLLGILLLETSGCSKETGKRARASMVDQPTMPAARSQQPELATSAMPAPAAKPARKKSRQHKLAAATYTNPIYGISFRYPKRYSLKEGEEAGLEWAALEPAKMNFVQLGGTTVSAVALPQQLFPGTDLAAAFFNISVNPKLTAAECAQFAVPEAASTDTSQDNAAAEAASAEAVPAKVGSAVFTEVESSSADNAKHTDAKYYHVFQNGACYEFALGFETVTAKDGVKPVDRNEVFHKLNWMLSTVKVQSAGVPEETAENPTIEGSKN